MLLAVDAGNTNIVFALVEDGAIRARWRIATDPRRTADQYAVWLHQLIELEGLPRGVVEAVIIGTVVPRALHNLQVLAQKYFKVEPLVAGLGQAEWGIELDVADPRTVGADRVLNAIAAHQTHPAISSSSISAPPPPSTRSTIPAPTRAASSLPASTFPSTPSSPPPPSCRASPSRRPTAICR
jgi:hypothetical protein